MVNSNSLKERAREMGIKQREIALAVGIQQSSLNLKINNKRPMNLEEAEIIAKILGISNSEFGFYFFNKGVA